MQYASVIMLTPLHASSQVILIKTFMNYTHETSPFHRRGTWLLPSHTAWHCSQDSNLDGLNKLRSSHHIMRLLFLLIYRWYKWPQSHRALHFSRVQLQHVSSRFLDTLYFIQLRKRHVLKHESNHWKWLRILLRVLYEEYWHWWG